MSSPEKYIIGLALVGLCFMTAAKIKQSEDQEPVSQQYVSQPVAVLDDRKRSCMIELQDASLKELSLEYTNYMCNCRLQVNDNLLRMMGSYDNGTSWGASANVCRLQYSELGFYQFKKKYPN